MKTSCIESTFKHTVVTNIREGKKGERSKWRKLLLLAEGKTSFLLLHCSVKNYFVLSPLSCLYLSKYVPHHKYQTYLNLQYHNDASTHPLQVMSRAMTFPSAIFWNSRLLISNWNPEVNFYHIPFKNIQTNDEHWL